MSTKLLDDVAVIEDTDTILEPPKKYDIIMLNDNVTTFDFVIEILCEIFDKDPAEAFEIASYIHENDSAVVGTYIHYIAKYKYELAKKYITDNDQVLQILLKEKK